MFSVAWKEHYGPSLHGIATTTEAVRRAIQHSQESLRALAKRYGSAGVEARAVVEIADAGDEQRFDTKADLKLVYLHGSGNGIAPSRLEAAMRGVAVPQGRTPYVWVAAESRAVRPIRKYLRHELGWPASRYTVIGYWTDRLAEWEHRWASLDPAIASRSTTLEKFGL